MAGRAVISQPHHRLASRIISVMAIVALISLVAAMGLVARAIVATLTQSHDFVGKIIGVNGHIFLQAAEPPFDDYRSVVAQVDTVPGVRLAIPLVEFAAGVSSPSGQTGALVRGLRESDLKALPGLGGHAETGSFDGFDKGGGVAIGQGLAQTLGLHVGDRLIILEAKGATTPGGVMPRVKSYPIVATFRIGLPQFDSLFVFMPLPEGQAFSGRGDEATVIELFLKRGADIDAVRAAVDAMARRPVVLTDWRERNASFFAAMKSELNQMLLVLALLVVAAAGIAVVACVSLVASADARASFPPQA